MDATTQPEPVELPPPVLAGEGVDRAKEAWNVNPTIEYLETIEVSK
jgi:hypothetical protein